MIRFITMEQVHNKTQVGSTKLRVHNLLKYWPEAGLYQYGERPDVLIFQKVYVTPTYRFPINYPGKKVLDICDPDWLDGAAIKETVDAMDAVVVPTKPLQAFLSRLTDKPVRLIRDRFDISEFPPPKVHTKQKIKSVVWFGYYHNTELLKTAIPLLSRLKIPLMVISEHDPQAWRWAAASDQPQKEYKKLYTYKKYLPETVYSHIQENDICILPIGGRPRDKYKSENKTILANLCGLPVAYHDGDLDELQDPEYRAKVAREGYNKAKKDYDCRISVEAYKELIEEISAKPKTR